MPWPPSPAYLASRTFATRLLHSVLSGITRDRLDLLGEEYFQYELKPKMRREAVDKLIEAVRSGDRVILVSQLLEHIVRPMTEYFGAEGFIANRLSFATAKPPDAFASRWFGRAVPLPGWPAVPQTAAS